MAGPAPLQRPLRPVSRLPAPGQASPYRPLRTGPDVRDAASGRPTTTGQAEPLPAIHGTPLPAIRPVNTTNDGPSETEILRNAPRIRSKH